jgi:hypothetical protein
MLKVMTMLRSPNVSQQPGIKLAITLFTLSSSASPLPMV